MEECKVKSKTPISASNRTTSPESTTIEQCKLAACVNISGAWIPRNGNGIG